MNFENYITGSTLGVYKNNDYLIIRTGTKADKIDKYKYILYPVIQSNIIFPNDHKFTISKEYINYFSGVIYEEDGKIIIEFYHENMSLTSPRRV